MTSQSKKFNTRPQISSPIIVKGDGTGSQKGLSPIDINAKSPLSAVGDMKLAPGSPVSPTSPRSPRKSYFPEELPPIENEEPTGGMGWRFHAAFGCLCVVNLVCALDATSLAVALPVSRILSAYDVDCGSS